MKRSNSFQLLEEHLELMQKASAWLQRSVGQCQTIKPDADLSAEQYDQLEALASRFARVVDLLINKIFRSIDKAELLEVVSLSDTINRAVKRGLITVEQARNMKELRNRIVHEYEVEDLTTILGDILVLSGQLIGAVEKTRCYSERLQSEP